MTDEDKEEETTQEEEQKEVKVKKFPCPGVEFE